MSAVTPTSYYHTPEPPVPTILEPVPVPTGYFPIEIVQFWRGVYAPGCPLPLHWALHVRTSASRGNTHEIVGDMDSYSAQACLDVPLDPRGDGWRGSHVVGYVSPERMDDLLDHITRVPVVRHRFGWNCQNWVFETVRGIKGPGMYADGNLTMAKLRRQMAWLLDAWERGDI